METLTAVESEEDCPVCGGVGTVPVLVYGFFTSYTQDRPCTAPIHQQPKESND
jgi:hypothetical protein